eukprot:m.78740 g.78740  ORF g.78740 m.78740 type:complete len:494 (+) comp16249_c0_seq1:286-1767(+)
MSATNGEEHELTKQPRPHRSFRSLCEEVGYPLVIVCGVVYFAQGFRSLASLSIQMFLKRLGLGPTTSQTLLSTAVLPWSVKPIYGLLSDYVPINGKRRQPYIFASGLLGVVSWICLAYVAMQHAALSAELSVGNMTGDHSNETSDIHLNNTGTDAPVSATLTWLVLASLLIGNLSTAVSDVVVDACVAERASGNDSIEDDLQGWCWNCMAVGGMLGSLVGAVALSIVDISGALLLTALCPLLVTIASTFLDEAVDAGAAAECTDDNGSKLWTEVAKLTAAVTNKQLWLPLVFFFLSGLFTPNIGQVWYFYVTDELKFSNEFLSAMGTAMWGMSIVGNYVAKRTMTEGYSYANAFWWGRLALTMFNVFSLTLVMGWNQSLGVPDHVFIVFGDAVETVLGQVMLLPFLSLAAKLTVPGVEATLFATFMSIHNLSYTVGSFVGVSICSYLGLRAGNYDNLWIAIVVRFGMMLIPLAFTRLCIPDHIVKEGQKEKEE